MPYDPERHGVWEIHQSPDGTLSVRLSQEPLSEPATTAADADEQAGTFALETHLRDYLAKNLGNSSDFGTPLTVYTSADGRDGVEFQTDIGPIDILATTRGFTRQRGSRWPRLLSTL